MDKVEQALRKIFWPWDGKGFSPQMHMRELPGWDSMNAVSLLVELEDSFETNLEGALSLTDDLTVESLLEAINRRVEKK
jgi:acyl carrier protein